MKDGIYRHFSALEIRRLAGLNVGSRFPIEGTMLGSHRSHLKGVSLEFSDYRAYVQGDDLRQLDWRVFARSERLYIRQYEQECNLRVYLLVDGSASMGYSHGGRPTKYQHAARLAAGLAYVTVSQQDSVGLTLFDTAIRAQLPGAGGAEHLRILSNRLADHEPARRTDLAQTLHGLAEKVRRRALVIVLTDLFDDLERLRQALAHFRRRRHDVILYHVLDPAEIEFPFAGDTAFTDLETGEQLPINPREIRAAYEQQFQAFLFQCRQMCANLDIDYLLADTGGEAPLQLQRHLARRRRRGRALVSRAG
jgi:uncharacterized protein (DUF58 family)